MFQYALIKFGSDYLTSDGLVSGDRALAEIEGLGPLMPDEISTPIIALDGTLFEQFTNKKGLPLSMSFPIERVSMWDAMNATWRASRTNGTTIPLYIECDAGIFDLNIRVISVEFPSTSQEAGIREPVWNMIVADVHTVAEVYPATWVFTPAQATLTVT